MRRSEVTAIGELTGQALAGAGGLARDVHAAIARRVFAAVGPAGAPVRVIHDGVAGLTYGSVRMALGAAPRGAALAFAATRSEALPLADSPRGRLALGLLNGYRGDTLATTRSALALTMSIRRHGGELPLERAALARALPNAAPRVVLFLHGLGETDAAWRRRADEHGPGYGARLQRDLGHTPIDLRYNSGRPISDNGRALAALLEELCDAWPVPIEELALVGHSMGGLVARSACHHGRRDGRRWTSVVRHVICLGSPHRGAPLEKSVHALGWALHQAPETRPFARLVNARSAGIKDLRHGGRAGEDRVPPRVRVSSLAATVTRRPRHPVGVLVGDLLVRVPSAAGTGGPRLGGLNHFDLLNHPAVYEQIRDRLAR
jgi:pimeloyl-ACP methyl ester carboxylesterase